MEFVKRQGHELAFLRLVNKSGAGGARRSDQTCPFQEVPRSARLSIAKIYCCSRIQFHTQQKPTIAHFMLVLPSNNRSDKTVEHSLIV